MNSAYHRRVAFPSELGNSTTRQLRDLSPALIIPLGSTEQHGPHLPLDTDTRIATAVARSVAERFAGGLDCWRPPIGYGASGEHEGFPRHGVDRHVCPAAVAGRVRQVRVQLGVPPGLRQRSRRQRAGGCRGHRRCCGTRAATSPGARAPSPGGDAHAGHTETSVLLHISPDDVWTRRTGARQRGAAGRADAADAQRAASPPSAPSGCSVTPPLLPPTTARVSLPRWSRTVCDAIDAVDAGRRGDADSDGTATARRVRRPGGSAGEGARRGLGAARRLADPAACVWRPPRRPCSAAAGSRCTTRMSAQLARTLLDATVAHPRPASGPSHRDVTVVIPVRDNAFGLDRLVAVAARHARGRGRRRLGACPVQVRRLRRPALRRPGAAPRRAARGPRRPATPDWRPATPTSSPSSTPTSCPRRGWLEALLGHFCDPAVALVAPRIVGLREPENLVARYEAVRSSLDLGQREAPGGALRHGVVRAERRDHLPPHRRSTRSAGSTRRSGPARTSTCAGASSRPAPGCATSRSRWSATTIARNCETGSRARLSTARRLRRCRSGIPARRRRW